MELNYYSRNGMQLAEVTPGKPIVISKQTAFDLMATAYHEGCSHVIIHEENLDPDFFVLQTGVAGEILQKFSNYRMNLIIVGEFEKYTSRSLQAFITECNSTKQVIFTSDLEATFGNMPEDCR